MRLSAREKAGLRLMIELARRYGEGPVSLTQVADTGNLPRPYLERIMPFLRHAGLLTSVRGAHGGYMLARPPREIQVSTILRALEGQLLALDCISAADTCENVSVCAAREVWRRVFESIEKTLDSITLADIISA